MKRYIIMFMSLVCVACKVDFDFRDLDSDPILHLDMDLVMGPGSHHYLSGFVYPVPSAAGERDFSEELYCRMEVYHNSKLVWTRDDIMLHEFAGSVSAEIEGLAPGDNLKVVAQAEGFPKVEATVTVPHEPPYADISHSRINASRFRMSITIDDDPATEDYYAFAFTKGFFYEGHLQPSGVGPLEPSFGSTESTSFLDLGPFDVIWEDGEKFYGISDREFNGRKKTIDINMEYPLSGPEQGNHAYYKVYFCRVSPERFRYETACQDKGNNVLGFIGLAPSTFAYTNVTGGTGCISCSNGYETDWIAVPPVGPSYASATE